ncbi:MAG: GGDEF domain-containing protein [Chloroflexi bacterium]|nr:GGDEF domain-containing protein [Chloroflexota bacterium]
MVQTTPKRGDELIRLADLEWLDLSDLIRMDDDWRRTLVTISRMHLAINAVLSAIVVAYTLLGRLAPAALGEYVGMGGVVLCVAAMAYLAFKAGESEARLLRNLRFVVFLSILAVSLMVFLLRDLQGDYYLLYFLPLVSAAGYLGFTGGLFAGVVSAFAYAVVFFLSPVAIAPGSLSALVLRTLIFILVASLLGLIAERHLSLLSALRASHTQAIQFAITDTKTGLFNQDFLQSRLRGEMSRAERSKTPVSFLVVDVNGLDQINREHGYSTGDAVLKALGETIQKQLRVTDVPSRWGVDEFGVLLYNSDAKGAEIVAHRIAGEIARQTFADPTTKRPFQVTIAEGIASFPVHTQDKSGTELVDRAYQAMRRAKANHGIAVWS